MTTTLELSNDGRQRACCALTAREVRENVREAMALEMNTIAAERDEIAAERDALLWLHARAAEKLISFGYYRYNPETAGWYAEFHVDSDSWMSGPRWEAHDQTFAATPQDLARKLGWTP